MTGKINVRVRRFKTQQDALREIAPYVRDARYLINGRPFRNFKMLPREVLGNWLLCAVANHERGSEQLTIASDPFGGDGIIIDEKAGTNMQTEHVFVPKPRSNEAMELETLIANAVAHKHKKGSPYAKWKALVIFSDAIGRWFPNRLARKLAITHSFVQIWIICLQSIILGKYAYRVSMLDLSFGDTPVWRVRIAKDFRSWRVTRVQ